MTHFNPCGELFGNECTLLESLLALLLEFFNLKWNNKIECNREILLLSPIYGSVYVPDVILTKNIYTFKADLL